MVKNNCSLSVSVQSKVKLFPTFAPESAGVMTIPPDEHNYNKVNKKLTSDDC